MIEVISSGSSAASLVQFALIRSCCANMVTFVHQARLSTSSKIFVFISPSEAQVDDIILAFHSLHNKIIIFGTIPSSLWEMFNISVIDEYDFMVDASCRNAEPHNSTTSEGRIVYRYDVFGQPFTRYFCRYDYADEWNNLGYGKISHSGIYGISMPAKAEASEILGTIKTVGKEQFTFASIFNADQSAVLWVNREVGTIDGPDWKVVEDFISTYRAEDLPTFPVLRDIPFGYQSAVTMRLDCDEDIASSEPLIELYHGYGFPLSLAIKSSLLDDPKHHPTLQKLVRYRGSILSHSHMHYPQWGGNYETALYEAQNSKKIIEENTGEDVRYVVSPFHQTPSFSRGAISHAGYKGCIGGVMNSDPDFILAKGGILSHDHPLIGHSQQSMFHGHTIQAGDNPLSIFKEAFELASVSGQIYGYLDHPFSERYWYDWESENSRVSYHEMFLKFLTNQNGIILFNENDCLDFLSMKSSCFVDGQGDICCSDKPMGDLNLAFKRGDDIFKVSHEAG